MDRKTFQEIIGCTEGLAEKYFGQITTCMDCYLIDTPVRQAAFLAQIGHESGGLMVTEENMNYSAKGLRATWPNRFTESDAERYARKPEWIGNRAYQGRMGNGDEASGDGYRYRGRGLIQLTGKDDYRECGEALGLDLLGCPELLNEPANAAMSAGWEWDRSKLNAVADSGDFEKLTRIINGGLNGYPDRLERWERAKPVLGV